jgi:hypothetical protein
MPAAIPKSHADDAVKADAPPALAPVNRAMDEELHRHAAWNLDQADALLFGRVTSEMMEAAWRPQAMAARRPWLP